MSTQWWIRKALDARGIPYEDLHHHNAYTALEVAENEHFSGHFVAKVVVVMADGKPVELVLPATRRVHFDRLRTLLDCKEVRLATEAEMEKCFDDCEVGAIPALRHWKDVEVWMDRSMRVDGQILLQGGTHMDAVRLKFKDWFGLVNPRVGTFSVPIEVARA